MTDEENEQNPWTRPGFIASAGVVALILVLALILGITTALRDDTPGRASASPPARPTGATPTTTATTAAGASVCGLDGVRMTGTLATAPASTWEFQGTIAYPSSKTFGPAAKTGKGVRYCFQHSPAGALFMAANALAQASDPQLGRLWASKALGEGPYREQLLGDITKDATNPAGIRLEVAGFRILKYAGDTARIDLGILGSSKGQMITASAVYDVVWQDGDWKIGAAHDTPLDFATIPNLAGYIPWKA